VFPRPTAAEVARLYGADYFEAFIEGPGVAGGSDEISPAHVHRLDELERWVGKGRLVDLGSGLGHLVARARDSGWDAIGVEPSTWAAQWSRRRYGITVYDCQLDQAPLQPASVDVVHANHVLEHVLDPIGCLRRAYQVLRPGGILVIEVPQELVSPINDRVMGWLRRSSKPASGPRTTYHLTFFSKQGLKLATERSGFVVDKLVGIRQPNSTASRIPLGSIVKSLLYRLEERTGQAPSLLMFARRPDQG
jgi:SAM-dependent methyltransferase